MVVQVVKMSRLLELTSSSYYPAYCSMMNTVTATLDEAREVRYSRLHVHVHYTNTLRNTLSLELG